MGLGQGLAGQRHASVLKVRAKMVNPSLENFNPAQKMGSESSNWRQVNKIDPELKSLCSCRSDSMEV